MSYSEYTVTVKTDCSYWGEVSAEMAHELAFDHSAKIRSALSGINVRYCDMIGYGKSDKTDGPDEGVCEKIDGVVAEVAS